MSIRITGLDPQPFLPLYGLPDDALRARGAMRVAVDETPGYPDRVELRDVPAGGSVLLLNHLHQPADTPYRASHAIYVREGARTPFDGVDEVPEVLRIRLLSLRAFDAAHMMVEAEVIDGGDLREAAERLLALPGAAYLHAHYAKRGCYAARVERA